MRRVVHLALVGLISLGLVGCPKLVRKKKLKAEDLIPVYTFNDSYDLKTPEVRMEIYDKNFTYWKTSHRELVEDLEALAKRRTAYFGYTLDYLSRMQSLLNEPLKSDLKIYIGRYNRLKSQITATELSYSRQVSLKSRLRYLSKDIVRDFSPRNTAVKDAVHAEESK